MKKAPTSDQLVGATSDYFSITVDTLRDPALKDRHIVYARHLALYLAYKELHMGGERVAAMFGYKSHASVNYARKRVAGWLKTNKLHTKRDLDAILFNLKEQAKSCGH